MLPDSRGNSGFNPPGLRPNYETYRSPHAPQYKIQPNFHGITVGRAMKFGTGAALFGGVGGFAALFFLSGVPKVRMDILEQLPIVGSYFHHEVPPEDNPF